MTKMIDVVDMTDAMLVSSTVAENDYAVWVAGAYVVGDYRILIATHKIYQALVAHTSTDATGSPDVNLTGTTPKWLEISYTNRWKQFDKVVGTATTATTSMTTVLAPGFVGGLGLMELVGSQVVLSMKDATGGTIVYTKTISLDNTLITYFADWFFTEYEQLTETVVTDLPDVYSNPELTVTTTGTGTIKCGVLKFGKVFYIADAEYGSQVSILDYSVKSTDAFGNLTVVQRAFSRRANLKMTTEQSRFSAIFNRLSKARSKLNIYVATDVPGYGPMIVYGYYKDLTIVVQYFSQHTMNLEIEGVI